jgi:hypothetical protein
MSKRKIKVKPGLRLVSIQELIDAGSTKDIGCVRAVFWENILGEGWEHKSDAENYEDYKKWYFKNCTKLGRYLYE